MENLIGSYLAAAIIVGAWYLIGEYLDAVLSKPKPNHSIELRPYVEEEEFDEEHYSSVYFGVDNNQ